MSRIFLKALYLSEPGGTPKKHRMDSMFHAVPPEPKAGLIFNWWR
ncbi:MAG: hypothetical protein ACLVLA_13920 [Acidaminococcus intestini]|uniref:Uncharacterized protein n=1 Tax=Acidaminococcus intestini (strain RyC-MR95) TaxID=568816 RepID=G4Q8R3_ACIIR|nr:hypothetical protein [Acidaminococcus intestini]AEQ22496.1 hypothetical protein Acin_1271 [Acidaminococcus intestini RyC-MR95]ERL16608.1 hypothetical protein HMPREF1246_0782 [Acidaminococcus sp. BV3L6]